MPPLRGSVFAGYRLLQRFRCAAALCQFQLKFVALNNILKWSRQSSCDIFVDNDSERLLKQRSCDILMFIILKIRYSDAINQRCRHYVALFLPVTVCYKDAAAPQLCVNFNYNSQLLTIS
jgi:hypothetical protein